MSIYDFAQDARGEQGGKRLLVDEDFSWSEVPRRRITGHANHGRSHVPEPTRSVADPEPSLAVVDEDDEFEVFDDGVEAVDLRAPRHRFSSRRNASREAYVAEGSYFDDDAYAHHEEPLASADLDERGEVDESAAGGRRTVVITGHGTERRLPVRQQHGGAGLRAYERSGFKPDRIALWAFLLALALLLGATTSSHAATLVHHLPH